MKRLNYGLVVILYQSVVLVNFVTKLTAEIRDISGKQVGTVVSVVVPLIYPLSHFDFNWLTFIYRPNEENSIKCVSRT